MWETDQLDLLVETILQRLLSEHIPAASIAYDLVQSLAQTSPDLPALGLNLPFALAASAIDEMLGASSDAPPAALDAWRVSALVGTEVLALTAHSPGEPVTLHQLYEHWRTGDAVFSPHPEPSAG